MHTQALKCLCSDLCIGEDTGCVNGLLHSLTISCLCFRALVPDSLSRGLEFSTAQKSDQQAHLAPTLEASASFLLLFLPWKLIESDRLHQGVKKMQDNSLSHIAHRMLWSS